MVESTITNARYMYIHEYRGSAEVLDTHHLVVRRNAAMSFAIYISGLLLVAGPFLFLLNMIEGPLDPTKELSRLFSKQKYEDAFTIALQRSDVTIVSWLCSQVDLSNILTMKTLPLSQGVLLSHLQQLACDISKDTFRNLMLDNLSATEGPNLKEN